MLLTISVHGPTSLTDLTRLRKLRESIRFVVDPNYCVSIRIQACESAVVINQFKALLEPLFRDREFVLRNSQHHHRLSPNQEIPTLRLPQCLLKVLRRGVTKIFPRVKGNRN